jgi:hypothetical protein
MAIYLIHFDQPYEHASHYLGFVDTAAHPLAEALPSRMNFHRTGRGNPLLKAVTDKGIPWSVVRVWETGTRTQERQLKGHSSTRLCPTCNPRYAGRGRSVGASLVGPALLPYL